MGEPALEQTGKQDYTVRRICQKRNMCFVKKGKNQPSARNPLTVFHNADIIDMIRQEGNTILISSSGNAEIHAEGCCRREKWTSRIVGLTSFVSI